MDPNGPEVTARHEASHAVVAWWLGHTVTWVHFRSDKARRRTGKLGRIRHRWSMEPIEQACSMIRDESDACQCKRIKLAKEIVVTCAGPLSDYRMGVGSTDNNDDREVIELADKLSDDPKERERLIKALDGVAGDIMDRVPAGINLITLALLKEKVLRRDRIHGLLREPPGPWFHLNEIARIVRSA
jgi:hypothetical protein